MTPRHTPLNAIHTEVTQRGVGDQAMPERISPEVARELDKLNPEVANRVRDAVVRKG